jgi:hypothetical protein
MILALAFQLAASSPYSAAERDQWDRVAKTVTIHRDKYGVPHVYGRTDASVVFGVMYAQAETTSGGSRRTTSMTSNVARKYTATRSWRATLVAR